LAFQAHLIPFSFNGDYDFIGHFPGILYLFIERWDVSRAIEKNRESAKRGKGFCKAAFPFLL
jgi:hypothetical protein